MERASEQQLVRDLKAKLPIAFTKLYDAYSPALFGVILRMVKEKELAEDLLHDTFIKIWTNITHFDSQKGRLFTWLLTLTRNVVFDELRAQKNQQKVAVYLIQDAHSADRLTLPDNIIDDSVLGQLIPIHRQVVELSYYMQYSHQEIADHLALPLGTVKTRIRSAHQKLQKILSQDIHHYHLAAVCR